MALAGSPILDSSWSLTLLGGWQLTHDQTCAVVNSRERRVLSLLALRGEHPRSGLARTLWPDSVESKAYGNLRAAVWRIQRLHWGLLAEGHGTLLLAPHIQVDVHELRAVSDRLREGSYAPARLLRMLSQDELLPAWDEDWVTEERALLHQLRLRALEDLAHRLLHRRDSDGALQAAMRAVTIDPLRESAHRALIEVHLADGNHAEAERVYRSFRKRLRDELGVCVSRQMVDLVQSMRRGGTPAPAHGLGPITPQSVPG